MFVVFNNQWKRIFKIKYVNDLGQFIDCQGVAHDARALRLVRPTERLPEDIENPASK